MAITWQFLKMKNVIANHLFEKTLAWIFFKRGCVSINLIIICRFLEF